jgi:hypothetical protein
LAKIGLAQTSLLGAAMSANDLEFYTQLDERAAWFYETITTSAGMVTKTPGVGQVYLSAYKDKDGDWLDGAKTYLLRVPPTPLCSSSGR